MNIIKLKKLKIYELKDLMRKYSIKGLTANKPVLIDRIMKSNSWERIKKETIKKEIIKPSQPIINKPIKKIKPIIKLTEKNEELLLDITDKVDDILLEFFNDEQVDKIMYGIDIILERFLDKYQ